MAEQAYLATYPLFKANPQSTALANFGRLARSQNWRQGGKKYKAERDAYMTALAEEHIGSIEVGGADGRLAELQGLCREVGVQPMPVSIKQCKKALQKVNVCIVCLIDHRRLGTPVKAFNTLAELQAHIKNEKHYFPRDKAKKVGNSLLAHLLRRIVD